MTTIPAAPDHGEIVRRLRALEATRKAFVTARTAMNAAIPPISATRAERALYDERYQADHDAERSLFADALGFATDAQKGDWAALIEALFGERDRLNELMSWFGSQHRLALDYYSPVYGDDDDQATEWRVTKESGSINDREWDIVDRGETPLAALIAARAALAPGGGAEG